MCADFCEICPGTRRRPIRITPAALAYDEAIPTARGDAPAARTELLALRWSDLDPRHKRIAVRHTLRWEGPDWVLEPPKTGASRRVLHGVAFTEYIQETYETHETHETGFIRVQIGDHGFRRLPPAVGPPPASGWDPAAGLDAVRGDSS